MDQFQNEVMIIAEVLKEQKDFSVLFLHHHLTYQCDSFQIDSFLKLLDLASSLENSPIDFSSLSFSSQHIKISFAGSEYIEKSPSMLLMIHYYGDHVSIPDQVVVVCTKVPSFLLPVLILKKPSIQSEQITRLCDWIISADLNHVTKYCSLAFLLNEYSIFVGPRIITQMKIETDVHKSGYLLVTLESSNEYLTEGLKVIQQKPSFLENLTMFLKFSQPNGNIIEAIISSKTALFILESLNSSQPISIQKDIEKPLVLLLQYSTKLSDHFGLTLQGFQYLIRNEKINSFLNIAFANDEIMHREIIPAIFDSQNSSFRLKAVEKIVNITSFSSSWNLNICKKGCLAVYILKDEELLNKVPKSFLSILFRFNCNFEESKLLISKFLKKEGNDIPALHDNILRCITDAVDDDWPEGYFIIR
jgi:hypothetical protein